MKLWEQITLVETCSACPEQYDAYLDGKKIGYLRLRHGYFRAEHNGTTVYSTETLGDGIFDSSEKGKHLKKAKKAIAKSIKKLIKR